MFGNVLESGKLWTGPRAETCRQSQRSKETVKHWAEPLLRQALADLEASLGVDHPQVLNCARNLAVLLKQKAAPGALPEAEALLKRAASGYAEALGADHPETQRLRRNLANFRNSALMVSTKHDILREDAWGTLFGLQARPKLRPLSEMSSFLERPRRCRGSFIFVGDESDDPTETVDESDAAAREKEEDAEFSLDPFPKTCEARACEAAQVEGCMDNCRAQYLLPRPFVLKPLPEEDRKVCYNACIDHCVLGRTQDGLVRPQCPLVNGYSERYSVWESSLAANWSSVRP
eukprot:g2172.t1